MKTRFWVSSLTAGVLTAAGFFQVACGDDASEDDSSVSDDDRGDDSSEDDDAAEDDDVSTDDDATEDDDVSADDDQDDDDGSTTTFETDAGSVQVIFGGEGVECGNETCLDGQIVQEGQSVLPPLKGCCADEDTEACGLDLTLAGLLIGLDMPSCEPLDLPGSADDGCEDSAPLEAALDSVNGIVLPGCCQANGKCGYLASLQGIGFGCMSPTRFGADEGADCTYEP